MISYKGALDGKKIVLIDVMGTLLSPLYDGFGYEVRAGAPEFFSWCKSNGIDVGIHSDAPSEKIKAIFEESSLRGVNYFWGGEEHISVLAKLPAGEMVYVKNFSGMLEEAARSAEEGLVISDGDVEAAMAAGIRLIRVPYFGLEGILGEKFDFRELIPN